MGAKFLLDRTWTGQGGSAVLGPENLSFNEMAAIMSDVLEKTVRFQQVPADTYKAQLIQHGANQIFAQGIADILIAKDNGMDTSNHAQPRIQLDQLPPVVRGSIETRCAQLNLDDRAPRTERFRTFQKQDRSSHG